MWERLKQWRGWAVVIIGCGLLVAALSAVANLFRRPRVVRDVKRVKIDVPEVDHAKEYEREKADRLDDPDDDDRDPERLSKAIDAYRKGQR